MNLDLTILGWIHAAACVVALGVRFVVLGAALTSALVAGYFLLPSHQLLWYGVVCGGGLVLAGLWMRRA